MIFLKFILENYSKSTTNQHFSKKFRTNSEKYIEPRYFSEGFQADLCSSDPRFYIQNFVIQINDSVKWPSSLENNQENVVDDKIS